jgi:hypothetical protein
MEVIRFRFFRVLFFIITFLITGCVLWIQLEIQSSHQIELRIPLQDHAFISPKEEVESSPSSGEPCATRLRVRWMQEWYRRKTAIRKWNMHTWRNIHIDHSRRLIFCEVPKAASSSIKEILIETSPLRPRIKRTKNAHRDLPKVNIAFPEHDLSDFPALFTNYFKFLVVRQPLHRLVSAYKDKFYDSVFLKKMSQHIIANYRDTDYHLPDDVQHLHPTWKEFATFVSAEYDELNDRHWRRVGDLCAPCFIPYDAILKVETLETDLAVIWKNISTQSIPFLPHENSSQDPERIRNRLDELPASLLHKLTGVYLDDFDMLGYTIDSGQRKPKSIC